MTETSVIIPCFNERLFIADAIQSVLKQARGDIEIIVVDDGSTDGSPDFVEKKFSGVKVIKTTHAGASRARNVGTRSSGGRYVQYLDADDWLMPGKLAVQIDKLDQTGADVAYGDWEAYAEKGDGIFVKERTVQRQLSREPEIDLIGNFWCPTAAYLFRRTIVERIGGWNESLPIIQDARFVLDCALHKAAFAYCPGIMAGYRRHREALTSRCGNLRFVRDCFYNARQVADWWVNHGGITEDRKQALVKVYNQVARGSYRKDAALFEEAYAALRKLIPAYCPDAPWHLRLASRWFGYRNAEEAAFWWRTIKGFFQP